MGCKDRSIRADAGGSGAGSRRGAGIPVMFRIVGATNGSRIRSVMGGTLLSLGASEGLAEHWLSRYEPGVSQESPQGHAFVMEFQDDTIQVIS